ncbi:GNAT family N-acetyltransferase [Clostridiaceae bacterium M8S5]|nr:GNAT family N-acetyltransferase [Clostridiaceae bacterium M8S5]
MLNHTGTKLTETDRLILRRFTINDAQDMFNNWASDKNVAKYLSWKPHHGIHETRDIINSWIKNYDSNEYYLWAIELKDSNKVIGSINLLHIDNKNKCCDIGYCIGRDYWNKGIVTEATKGTIKLAFLEIGFEQICARHHIDNIASGKVLIKCGLTPEAELRKIVTKKGILEDRKCYAILKKDY